ncbi:hypothetical protein GMJAKD_08040 [Candidatus Electrothrix aarhusensis]
MSTKIICLANSKKYNERCVAGIAVEKPGDVYKILKCENKIKWIRPVSQNGHGEFPVSIAQGIKLLDIVEFTILNYCPSGYQSENAYFDGNSVRQVASIKLSSSNLDKLTSNCGLLFGNRGKAVHPDEIDTLDHSLVFIKVEEYQAYIKPENNQLRMTFSYQSNKYDLSVTDMQFDFLYRGNAAVLHNINHLYLTVSLAVEYNGWHTKLIAGVVYS